MRAFLHLLLLTVVLIIPSSNGCVPAVSERVNVKKVDCRKEVAAKKIKNTPNIILFSSHCEDYTFNEEIIREALGIFVLEYSEHFELEKKLIWSHLSNLKIELSIIPKAVNAAYDMNGNLLEGDVPVSGLALNPKHIWVEVKTSQIWSSSLVHELVHIIIWHENLGIHADPDHEGEQYSGWTKEHTNFIKFMRFKFQDLGI